MSLYDILGTPNNDEISSPSFENMDVSLDYNSTDLMTSDFFDSVLSLSEGNLENGLDNEILSNFDDDVNILSESSSHTDEVFSPRSTTSDSEKSSIQNESSDEYVSSNFSRFEPVDENLLMSLLEPAENVKVFEANSTTFMGNKSRPTKIVIQNPNNKKIIVTKPIIHSSQLKELSPKMKKILKVQSINGSGKSVLLPFNVKSIKILNASDIKTEGIRVSSSVIDSTVAQCKIEPASPSSIDDDDVDVVSSTDNQYPALHLSNEEKRLLSKEGIQLPTHYPLTKNEERELKRIRRKIRNKISAQDSRKRKKEYVDGLEERVQRSSEEKKYLLQRIKQLQRQNNKLMSHFSKLQSLLFKSSQSKATPSTCVMIVLLSALLVSLPNIRLPQRQLNEVEQGARRALLSSNLDEDIHMDEFLVFKDDAEHQSEMDGENITEKELSNMFEDTDKGWHEKENMFDKMLENLGSWLKPTTSSSKRVFIEPDIDDGPPMKRTCFDLNVVSDVQPAPDPQIPLITTTTIGLQNSKDK